MKKRNPDRFCPYCGRRCWGIHGCEDCTGHKSKKKIGEPRIAIFPVRANPPHTGHFISFLKIIRDYDKIYIAVSNNTYDGKKPGAMTQKQVKEDIEAIMNHIPGYEVIFTKIPFIKRKKFDDLPKFDIVVTGNHEVFDNMKKLGIKVRFLERTPYYRSMFIKDAYRKGIEYEECNSNNNGCC